METWVEEIEDWEARSVTGGYDGLRDLADREFSGVVSTGGTWLFMVNGRVVGIVEYRQSTTGDDVRDADIEAFEGAEATAYTAPDPSVPLLVAMKTADGETRAKYYTEDTPVDEVHGTLTDGGFTGYLELSENVLSGDYYLVYQGGRASELAFVGNARRLLTDDEAFDRTVDEVGIYEVTAVDLDIVDVPEPDEDTDAGTAAAAASGAASGAAATADGADDGAADGTDADAVNESSTREDPTGPDAREGTGSAGDATAEPGEGEAIESEASGDGGQSATGTAAAEQSDPASTETASETATGAATDDEAAAGEAATGEAADGEAVDSEDAEPGDDRDVEQADGHETGSGGTADDPNETSTDRQSTAETTAAEPSTADQSPAGASTAIDEPNGSTSRGTTTGTSTTNSRSAGTAGDADRASERERSDDDPATGGARSAGGGGTAAGAATDSLVNRSIPSLDPDRTGTGEDGGDGRERAATESRQSAQAPTGRAEGSTGRTGNRADARRERSGGDPELEQELEEARATLQELRDERDAIREERDDLQERVETLQQRVADLEADVEEARTAAAEAGAATGGGPSLSIAEAFAGTNLFVRYESKGELTLEDVHDGKGDPGDLAANLELEHHTQFEDENASVAGQRFEEWLRGTQRHRFVQWLVGELLFEIRDTGAADAMRDLYDALPEIDRVELDAAVEIETEEGIAERSFGLVARDRMGQPLVVANLDSSRDPVSEASMASLVESGTEVCSAEETFSGAFFVASSFFDPDALETAREATSDSLLSRDRRKSFVKLSRKRGFHLGLVEARDGSFHLSVPDL